MSKKPMPLKNLPQYLKSIKETGDTGSAPVVSMGQICETPVAKRSFIYWSQQAIFSMMMLIIISLGSFMTYNMYDMVSVKQFTVIMDVENGSSQSITKIVSDIGGEVITVKQNADSSYEVKVKTRKNKKTFLDWLLSKEGVKKAHLEK
jgi:hypothetical protein